MSNTTKLMGLGNQSSAAVLSIRVAEKTGHTVSNRCLKGTLATGVRSGWSVMKSQNTYLKEQQPIKTKL